MNDLNHLDKLHFMVHRMQRIKGLTPLSPEQLAACVRQYKADHPEAVIPAKVDFNLTPARLEVACEHYIKTGKALVFSESRIRKALGR